MGRAPYAKLPPADLALLAADPALRTRYCELVLTVLLPPLRRLSQIVATKMHLNESLPPARLDSLLPGIGRDWTSFIGTLTVVYQHLPIYAAQFESLVVRWEQEQYDLLQPDSPTSEEHRDDTGELLSPLRRELRPRAERAESAIFWLCAIFGYLGVMLYAIKSNCDADCKSHLNYGVLLNNKHKWRWFAEHALLYFTVPSVTILVLLLIWALARRRTLKFWMLIRAIRRVEDWRDIPQVY